MFRVQTVFLILVFSDLAMGTSPCGPLIASAGKNLVRHQPPDSSLIPYYSPKVKPRFSRDELDEKIEQSLRRGRIEESDGYFKINSYSDFPSLAEHLIGHEAVVAIQIHYQEKPWRDAYVVDVRLDSNSEFKVIVVDMGQGDLQEFPVVNIETMKFRFLMPQPPTLPDEKLRQLMEGLIHQQEVLISYDLDEEIRLLDVRINPINGNVLLKYQNSGENSIFVNEYFEVYEPHVFQMQLKGNQGQARNLPNTPIYYQALGVGQNASPEEIREAFLSLVKPFLNDSSQKSRVQLINEAYSVLGNSAIKNVYDRRIQRP